MEDARQLKPDPEEIGPSRLAAAQAWLERVLPTFLPPACTFGVQRYDLPYTSIPIIDEPSLRRAIPKRQLEFSAGRVASQQALAALGQANVAVPMGQKRNPLWPVGIAGSITHTAGLAVAVTALAKNVVSLGIDLELATAVTPSLWASVLNKREIEWLQRRPALEQASLATLFFCAKESFYKFQYALAEQWVDFAEGEVSIETKAPGEFSLDCHQAAVVARLGRSRFSGRYAVGYGFVFTAMHLEAPGNTAGNSPY
jgi:4'-phosphopantetheinyl transferase EntD